MKMPTLEQFRTNRNVLFWSLHAAGWAAYGVTQYFGALLYEKPSSYARVIAVAAVSGFLLSMPMRFIYRRLWGRPPRVMIAGVLTTCYITALALRIVINLSYKWFVEPDWQAHTLFELFGGALSTTYLLLCWSVLYFGIKFYESQRKQEQAMLKAVALAQEAQHFQLRLLRQGHRLEHRLFLLALRLIELDAEVQHAPAQQQVGRGQGAAEELEQRVRLPVRLHEPFVGQVDYDAQRERGDVAGREHARDHDARRPAPQAPVDEAHRHRQEKPRDRRHRDHARVAGRLLVQQRAEVLGNAVGGPARGVQAPEQHVAVGAELLERRHPHRCGCASLRLKRTQASRSLGHRAACRPPK